MPTYEDIIYSAEAYADIIIAIEQHPEHAEKLRGFLVEWVLDDHYADVPLEPQDPAATERVVKRAMERFWARLKEVQAKNKP